MSQLAKITQYIPNWNPQLFYDVGANVGQSALEINRSFPNAEIVCFEPVPASFVKLSSALAGLENATLLQCALGATARVATMQAIGTKTTNRILSSSDTAPDQIQIQVRVGTDIALELGHRHISYLKVDAEGYDFDVLLGFLPMIREIEFIEVEASMNLYNTSHIPMRRFEDLLRAYGFLLFGVYDQTMEWKDGPQPALRRANLVFINQTLTAPKIIKVS